MDLLGGTFFALAGLKLPANASKKWSGTQSELQRKKDRQEALVLWRPVASIHCLNILQSRVRTAHHQPKNGHRIFLVRSAYISFHGDEDGGGGDIALIKWERKLTWLTCPTEIDPQVMLEQFFMGLWSTRKA